MAEVNRRNSKQRQLVLEAVKSVHSHPTAEEVFQMVREKNPNISLGTVYRNLNLLSEMGLIMKLDLGCESDHFDGECKEHGHFICKKCGAIQDLPCESSQKVREILNSEMQQEMQTIYLTVVGLCKKCILGNNN